MKKYLPGLIAVVLAVGFNGFTIIKYPPRQTTKYVIHNGTTSATEKNWLAYTYQSTVPTLACPGAVIVCWFALADLNNDGIIQASEFNTRANQLDTDSDGIISDNQVETAGIYQEKQ